MIRMVFRGRTKKFNKKLATMSPERKAKKINTPNLKAAIFPGALPAKCTHTAHSFAMFVWD